MSLITRSSIPKLDIRLGTKLAEHFGEQMSVAGPEPNGISTSDMHASLGHFLVELFGFIAVQNCER